MIIGTHIEDSGCHYIQAHLNAVFYKGNLNFAVNYLEDSLVDEIVTHICEIADEYIVIDLFRIRSIGYLYDKFSKALSLGKCVIFYRANEYVKSKLLIDFSEYFTERCTNDCEILTNESGFGFFTSIANKDNLLEHNLRITKIRLIGDFINANSSEKEEYLKSSNIYANKYLNVKFIFANPWLFKLVIYELCCIVSDNYNSYDSLICVSSNGAAISTIMGKILKKNIIYLLNLGPNITIKDIKVIDEIQHGKKYIFIYDFICLGTEYKIARIISKTRGAEVLGAVGVATHLDISNVKTQPLSIFEINKDYQFNYELYIYPRG